MQGIPRSLFRRIGTGLVAAALCYGALWGCALLIARNAKQNESNPVTIPFPDSGLLIPAQGEGTNEAESDVTQIPEGVLAVNRIFLPGDGATLPALANSSGYAIDPDEILRREYPIAAFEDGPQVLIIHSHGTECYADAPWYSEDETFRTADTTRNMIAIGDVFAAVLKENGISVLHDTYAHDAESYTGAYDSARASVADYLARYPSIRYVLDLHRDAITDGSGSICKPVTEIGGIRTAQIMLVVGTDALKTHPGWRDNLCVALTLQQIFNRRYPTLARTVCVKKSTYNQDLCSGMLLLECGACGNTLDEAKAAASLAAAAFCELYFTRSPSFFSFERTSG